MGASSVTGTGRGGAWNNKGPGNGRDQFVPLLSPRVVHAGIATLADSGSDSAVTIHFPTLDGVVGDYAFFCTPVGATGAIAAGGAAVSSFTTSAAVITSDVDGGTHSVYWMIVKRG